MNILIVYATNSGSTYLAGERIRKILSAGGHEVDMEEAKLVRPNRVKKYELVIFGSPTWHIGGAEAMPQEFMLALLEQMRREAMTPERYAAYGCGEKSFTIFCGAVDYIDTVLRSLGAKKVIPSLKIDGYYFHLLDNQKIVDKWATELRQKL
ncbi:MAG: flavodoxin domain-containing protein [Patescibacteria group bacterium]